MRNGTVNKCYESESCGDFSERICDLNIDEGYKQCFKTYQKLRGASAAVTTRGLSVLGEQTSAARTMGRRSAAARRRTCEENHVIYFFYIFF